MKTIITATVMTGMILLAAAPLHAGASRNTVAVTLGVPVVGISVMVGTPVRVRAMTCPPPRPVFIPHRIVIPHRHQYHYAIRHGACRPARQVVIVERERPHQREAVHPRQHTRNGQTGQQRPRR